MAFMKFRISRSDQMLERLETPLNWKHRKTQSGVQNHFSRIIPRRTCFSQVKTWKRLNGNEKSFEKGRKMLKKIQGN